MSQGRPASADGCRGAALPEGHHRRSCGPRPRREAHWRSVLGTLALLLALFASALLFASVADANFYYDTYYSSSTGNSHAAFIGCATADGSRVNNHLIALPKDEDVWALAADDQHIFWSNGTTIKRANLDGSDVKPAFIPIADVTDLAVDSGHVYWRATTYKQGWADGIHIGRANLDGSGVDPGLISLSEGSPLYWAGDALAVGGGKIYFTEWGGIGRANTDGTGVQSNAVNDPFIYPIGESSNPVPDNIVQAGQHLFWTFPGGIAPPTPMGRSDVDGTDVDEEFADGRLSGFRAFAADASHVYWLQTDSAFATAFTRIYGMAEDGTNVHQSVNTGTDHSWDSQYDLYGGIAVLGANGAPASICPAPSPPPPPPPPPDTSVDASVSANRVQKQRGKRIAVKVKVSAEEDLNVTANGTVKISGKTRPLSPVSGDVAAGTSEKLRLTMSSRRSKQVARALKRGKRVRANVTVKLSDKAQNVLTRHPSALLTR